MPVDTARTDLAADIRAAAAVAAAHIPAVAADIAVDVGAEVPRCHRTAAQSWQQHARTRRLLEGLPDHQTQSVDKPVHRDGQVDRPHETKADAECQHHRGRFAAGHLHVEIVGGLTDEGNIDLWPYDRKTITTMLARPDDHDFHIA